MSKNLYITNCPSVYFKWTAMMENNERNGGYACISASKIVKIMKTIKPAGFCILQRLLNRFMVFSTPAVANEWMISWQTSILDESLSRSSVVQFPRT